MSLPLALQVKRKLEDAIGEKMPPLNLAKSRYATRTKKPPREAIHDDVEKALLNQYDDLKVCSNFLGQFRNFTALFGEL